MADHTEPPTPDDPPRLRPAKLAASGLLFCAAAWSVPYLNYVTRFTPTTGAPDPFTPDGSTVWAFVQVLLVAAVLAAGVAVLRARADAVRATAWSGLALVLALCVCAAVDDWVRFKTLGIAYRRLPFYAQDDPLSDAFFHLRSPWQAVLVGLCIALALVVSRIDAGRGRVLRELLVRSALVVSPIVLAVGLLEVGLRSGVVAHHWGAFARGRQMFRTNWYLGWSNREGVTTLQECSEFAVTMRINRRGLRGREHAYDPPAGRCRLLCLGDSFTLGSGVEEEQTYSEVLSRELPAVDCLNAGVIGYGTAQEYLYYTTEGHRIERCEGRQTQPALAVRGPFRSRGTGC